MFITSPYYRIKQRFIYLNLKSTRINLNIIISLYQYQYEWNISHIFISIIEIFPTLYPHFEIKATHT